MNRGNIHKRNYLKGIEVMIAKIAVIFLDRNWKGE